MTTWLTTGGAGFIGSNFVHAQREADRAAIVTLDKLTYAGSLVNLEELRNDPEHMFIRGDVCDAALLRELLKRFKPDAVFHFAAESHVDRSIRDSEAFVQTNIVGTYRLLRQTHRYWEALPEAKRKRFR